MNILSKRTIYITAMVVLMSLNYSYAQSENSKINNLITQKRAFNKKNKTSIVFKIQIFNGIETKAYRIKQECKSNFPEYDVSVMYKNPEWKTHIGPFQTRLEADRALLSVKEKYSGAIVLEDEI